MMNQLEEVNKRVKHLQRVEMLCVPCGALGGLHSGLFLYWLGTGHLAHSVALALMVGGGAAGGALLSSTLLIELPSKLREAKREQQELITTVTRV